MIEDSTLIRSFDEGLGTVYERIIMNGIFDRLISHYSIQNVLEAPVYGMTGLTGINSVEFANMGCSLTTVDNDLARIESSKKLWSLMGLDKNIKFDYTADYSRLPFNDNSFDMVWNFAALWHVRDTPSLIKEMVRVSSNLVLICVQNNRQLGYFIRKYLIDRKLFKEVNELWIKSGFIQNVLQENGATVIENGFFDIPPFPDIAMPVGELLQRVGLRKSARGTMKADTAAKRWNWSVMDYYMGNDPNLVNKLKKFMFIENFQLPKFIKGLWAHHRYILCIKNNPN